VSRLLRKQTSPLRLLQVGHTCISFPQVRFGVYKINSVQTHAIQNEQQNKDSYVAAGAEGSV